MTRLQLSLLALFASCAIAACSRSHTDSTPPSKTHATSTYVAVARGRIDVEAGLLPLTASVPGVVTQVNVHIGDHVKKGDVLATLQSVDAQAAVTVARGTLDQTQAQARLIDAQLAAARRLAGTMAKAAAAGADSGQHAADARDHVAELQARSAAARAAATVAQGRLQQARQALDLHTLRAPRDAEIVDVQTQPGETVSPQSGPMFRLLPDAPRIVVAELGSEFASRVHAGMRAEVVLDDDSQHDLGPARVMEVGQVFEDSSIATDTTQPEHTRTVRCLLRFDHPVARRIGQRVLVRFLPDKSGGTPPEPN